MWYIVVPQTTKTFALATHDKSVDDKGCTGVDDPVEACVILVSYLRTRLSDRSCRVGHTTCVCRHAQAIVYCDGGRVPQAISQGNRGLSGMAKTYEREDYKDCSQDF